MKARWAATPPYPNLSTNRVTNEPLWHPTRASDQNLCVSTSPSTYVNANAFHSSSNSVLVPIVPTLSHEEGLHGNIT